MRRLAAWVLILAACSPAEAELPAVPSGDTTTTTVYLVAGIRTYETAEPLNRSVDESGIHIYERGGVRYRHPVGQAQYALSLVETWRHSGDPGLLSAAETNAQDLIDRTMTEGVLEYHFDFPLHGDRDNTIHAPWRSAMAQGLFLSLTIRLWEETGDPYWRVIADQTLDTLLDQESERWVTFTDENGMVWLEEYAGDVEPMRVFNGHVFAMYGLYDYWQATGSVEAAELFNSAAETILYYMPEFREPGDTPGMGCGSRTIPTLNLRSTIAFTFASCELSRR